MRIGPFDKDIARAPTAEAAVERLLRCLRDNAEGARAAGELTHADAYEAAARMSAAVLVRARELAKGER